MTHHNSSDWITTLRITSSMVNTSGILPETFDEKDQCYPSVLVIFSVLIILVNAFIVVIFFATKNLRKKPANILICSQACADLYIGLIFIPLYLSSRTSKESNAILPFLIGYMLYVALFNLLALAIDRYLAILKPLIHHKLIDEQYIRKIIILIWTVPLGLVLIPLLWWFQPEDLKSKLQRVYVCLFWSLILLIVIFVIILYFLITKQTRKAIQRRMADLRFKSILITANSSYLRKAEEKERILAKRLGETRRDERKLFGKEMYQMELFSQEDLDSKVTKLAKKELCVVHLFGLLLFSLVAAYSPILYMNIFTSILNKPSYVTTNLICVSLYSLIMNSVVTPVLCILLKRDYMHAIKRLISVVAKK